MIKVCDAQMGTGKTMACIHYMNERPEEKFIYITPYLTEARRIKTGCPDLRFSEPNHFEADDHSKVAHTAMLISKGKNIATTHAAFKSYTKSMLDEIKKQGYTLIIDESVDILEKSSIHPDDLMLLMKAGYIDNEGGSFRVIDKSYSGQVFKPIFKMLESRELIPVQDEHDKAVYYWKLTPDLLTSFKDVFILTYLFSGQSIHHFLEIYKIPYEFIGVQKLGENEYDFCEAPGYIPEYVRHIKDKLHVVDSKRMNRVGDDKYALSMNWFKKNIEAQSDEIHQLKRNLFNYFYHMNKDSLASERLWASFLEDYQEIRGRGYSNQFLSFNTRATNTYRDRKCLAYLSNVFMNATEKRFYESHGIAVDEDMYALSILVQWIWRSAIRDGQEVTLYIPSSRMRGLLFAWMDSLSEGGDADAPKLR